MSRRTLSLLLPSLLAACNEPAPPPPRISFEPMRVQAALTATQDTLLSVTAPGAGEQAGAAVALSADGTLLAIGVPRDESASITGAGSVRLFARVAGTWSEVATVRAPTPSTDALFGSALALSADGTRLLVGAPFENNGNLVDTGSAHVYLRTGASWALEASLPAPGLDTSDLFGLAVALSADGTRAFVSAPGDEALGVPTNAGLVRVYVRNASGWAPEAGLRPGDVAADDTFGTALAVNADGSLLLVGVRNDDTDAGVNAGTVRVFSRTGSAWTEEATLSAVDAAATDLFGTSVAVSADGLTALIGASDDDTDAGLNVGTVRPFAKQASAWVALPLLHPVDMPSTPGFGGGVALRGDGTRAVVSAVAANGGAGAARVYTLEDGGWVPDTALTALGPGAAFGGALALSGDGDVIAVGAPGYDTPASNAGAVAMFSLVGLSTGFACTSAGQCASGSCVDGFCCDAACGGGAGCQGCSSARTGQPNGTCAVVQSGRICRPSTGSCDFAEVCDGRSPACPGDMKIPPGIVCRGTNGSCDVAESCDGVNGACPSDQLRPAGTVCAPAFGPCDDTDVCDGVSPQCQPRFLPAGTVCNAVVIGACDAPDECTGASAHCPRTFIVDIECRASAGGCDLAEFCTGNSVDCPPDQFVPPGLVCRASRNLLCNPMESCSGFMANCPPDENTCVGDEENPVCPGTTCPEPRPQPPEPTPGCLQVAPGGADAALAFAVLAGLLRRRHGRG